MRKQKLFPYRTALEWNNLSTTTDASSPHPSRRVRTLLCWSTGAQDEPGQRQASLPTTGGEGISAGFSTSLSHSKGLCFSVGVGESSTGLVLSRCSHALPPGSSASRGGGCTTDSEVRPPGEHPCHQKTSVALLKTWSLIKVFLPWAFLSLGLI